MKEKTGKLGHVDCHRLGRELLLPNPQRYYLIGVMDDYTRIAWVELTQDDTELTIMFTALKMINFLNKKYGIQFTEIQSNNTPQFTSHDER